MSQPHMATARFADTPQPSFNYLSTQLLSNSISGLVVEYIVAIDVTRVRFPADAVYCNPTYFVGVACVNSCSIVGSKSNHRGLVMLLNVTAVGFEPTPLRTGA